MALVEYQTEDGLAILTLNRPEKRNSVTPALQKELEAAIHEAQADDGVTVAILTGAGQDFCCGGDFAVIEQMMSDEAMRTELARGHSQTADCILSFAKPIVAAVNGPALGIGAEFAAFCDMVVMSENAYLADPHVKLGVGPAPGALLIWPQLTSRAIAAELLLTGRNVMADEALRLGLANRVAPEGEALSVAKQMARELCGLPREGVLAVKHALRRSLADLTAKTPGIGNTG